MFPDDLKVPTLALLEDGRLITVVITLATARRVWRREHKEDIEFRLRQSVSGVIVFRHLLVPLAIVGQFEN